MSKYIEGEEMGIAMKRKLLVSYHNDLVDHGKRDEQHQLITIDPDRCLKGKYFVCHPDDQIDHGRGVVHHQSTMTEPEKCFEGEILDMVP